MKKQTKENILIILAVLILMLTVVGATYAYLNVSIINNTTPLNVATDTVTLEYTDCGSNNDSDSEDNHCQFIEAELKPGDSVEKTFRVRNIGTNVANYTIMFRRLLNTFTNNELVYKLEDITDSSNPITIVDSNTVVPYNATEANNIGITTDTVAINSTKEYKMTITFKNLLDNAQNYNLYARFLIQLGISQIDVYIVNGISGGNGTVTESSNIAKGGTATLTVTPNSGYYLSSGSCTNGYTISNMNTGSFYVNAQSVTINNNNVSNLSNCTFYFDSLMP